MLKYFNELFVNKMMNVLFYILEKFKFKLELIKIVEWRNFEIKYGKWGVFFEF